MSEFWTTSDRIGPSPKSTVPSAWGEETSGDAFLDRSRLSQTKDDGPSPMNVRRSLTSGRAGGFRPFEEAHKSGVVANLLKIRLPGHLVDREKT